MIRTQNRIMCRLQIRLKRLYSAKPLVQNWIELHPRCNEHLHLMSAAPCASRITLRQRLTEATIPYVPYNNRYACHRHRAFRCILCIRTSLSSATHSHRDYHHTLRAPI